MAPVGAHLQRRTHAGAHQGLPNSLYEWDHPSTEKEAASLAHVCEGQSACGTSGGARAAWQQKRQMVGQTASETYRWARTT